MSGDRWATEDEEHAEGEKAQQDAGRERLRHHPPHLTLDLDVVRLLQALRSLGSGFALAQRGEEDSGLLARLEPGERGDEEERGGAEQLGLRPVRDDDLRRADDAEAKRHDRPGRAQQTPAPPDVWDARGRGLHFLGGAVHRGANIPPSGWRRKDTGRRPLRKPAREHNLSQSRQLESSILSRAPFTAASLVVLAVSAVSCAERVAAYRAAVRVSEPRSQRFRYSLYSRSITNWLAWL